VISLEEANSRSFDRNFLKTIFGPKLAINRHYVRFVHSGKKF
jgi:hypothetical protein